MSELDLGRDGLALLLGFGIGLPVSALYFVGLAWGMQRALHSPHPARLLLASYLLRAGLLLGIGILLVRQFEPLWVALGYLAAFFLARLLAVRRARRRDRTEQSKWN
jgi:F1F0 ATPase subunit 2